MSELSSERNITLKIENLDEKNNVWNDDIKNINNLKSNSLIIIPNKKRENDIKLKINPKLNLTMDKEDKKITNYLNCSKSTHSKFSKKKLPIHLPMFDISDELEDEKKIEINKNSESYKNNEDSENKKYSESNKYYESEQNIQISENKEYSENNKYYESEQNIQISENKDCTHIQLKRYCQICQNELSKEELMNNILECNHYFCDSCFYEYLKEKININNIENINCPYESCETILYDKFIQSHLINDIPLLDKYLKFKQRKQLILNPNVTLCPYPNCESYALKNQNNKYVICKKGHKFCLDCLKEWHGKEECKIQTDKKFEEWRNSKNVKKCPKCKTYIEKIDGCNHMTCSNCKYQWCWLCLKEYFPDHFEAGGNCEGLQYTNYKCFSNRFNVFLYHLIIHIFYIFKLIAVSPVVFYIKVFNIIDYINSEMKKLAAFFIIFFLEVCLFTYIICITSLISFLTFFYWPLQTKFNDWFNDILNC